MAEKTISIGFDGYWRDVKKANIPADSGIYCVYECTFNKEESTVSLKSLIYIGESDNVQERIAKHEKYNDWLKHVNYGNQLCFTFGKVGSIDRERAEAAMIFKHKPPENTDFVNSFPFDKTKIILSGKIALLNSSFTLMRI